MADPKKGVAFTFEVSLVDSANRPQFKANPTLATGDFKISKDGGTLVNLTNLPTVSPAGSVGVRIALTAAEMTVTDTVRIECIDVSGAEWDNLVITIHPGVVTTDELVRAVTPANALVINALGGTEVGSIQAAAAITVADATLARDLSLVAGPAARSLLNAIRFFRNRWAVVDGVLTVYQEDDATPAWTAPVSTVPATNLIAGIDPS